MQWQKVGIKLFFLENIEEAIKTDNPEKLVT
jgi:hypothetical protein